MILVFDIGNTHIFMGIYKKNKLLRNWRLQSVYDKTEDEFFVFIKNLFDGQGYQVGNITGMVISSVVPELTNCFKHLSDKYFNSETIIITSELELGLKYNVRNRKELGSDIIVNAFAANKLYCQKDNKMHCIIIDFGTATTIQLIKSTKELMGVIICPGLFTSAETLFKKAALLSHIKLKAPKKILGNDTNSALLSGIITGNALMLDAFIKKIKTIYGSPGDKFITVATGGIAHLITKHTKQIDITNKNLTLDGLNLIYKHITNTKKGSAYYN